MPTTVFQPEFKTVKVPVRTTVTDHRIEFRNQLTHRPPSVYHKSYSAVNPLVSDCQCYQPTCGCQGQAGCGCSWPACGCAPQQHELSENYHTTGERRTMVRKVPVKVPYQREVIKYIDQQIAVQRPVQVLRPQSVLTNGSRKVNVLTPKAVESQIPGTV